MTKVIGYKDTPQIRMNRWSDLLEAKKSYSTFRDSSNRQEIDIAEVDKDFYYRNLRYYVA